MCLLTQRKLEREIRSFRNEEKKRKNMELTQLMELYIEFKASIGFVKK